MHLILLQLDVLRQVDIHGEVSPFLRRKGVVEDGVRREVGRKDWKKRREERGETVSGYKIMMIDDDDDDDDDDGGGGFLCTPWATFCPESCF